MCKKEASTICREILYAKRKQVREILCAKRKQVRYVERFYTQKGSKYERFYMQKGSKCGLASFFKKKLYLICKKGVTPDLLPYCKTKLYNITKILLKMWLTSFDGQFMIILPLWHLAHLIDIFLLIILIPKSPKLQKWHLLPFSRKGQYIMTESANVANSWTL